MRYDGLSNTCRTCGRTTSGAGMCADCYTAIRDAREAELAGESTGLWCADCQGALTPGAHDTIYECAYDPPLTLCAACWHSRETHVRWEAYRGFPSVRARQRRIEAALA